mgnify:CR=1 FL=1
MPFTRSNRMLIRIIKETGSPKYRVEWIDEGGHVRDREFYSYRAAERYAEQLDCRLRIDEFLAK